jgi:hypothetical protein
MLLLQPAYACNNELFPSFLSLVIQVSPTKLLTHLQLSPQRCPVPTHDPAAYQRNKHMLPVDAMTNK